MKNAFAVSSLILTTGYAAAIAAELIGVISFHVPGFSTFVGVYIGVGILAFAFGDYFRPSGSRARSASEPVAQTETRPALHPLSLTSATLHPN